MAVIHTGIGFFINAGIPAGKRSRAYVECSCCGMFHRKDFGGDCRTDSERFTEPLPDATSVTTLDSVRFTGREWR